MKKIILLISIVAIITIISFAVNGASEATKRLQSFVIETYDASDGLISGIVRQIYQDRKGDLWIGTSEGISRYDGKQFHNFTTKDGLSGNPVFAIAEDDGGNLWLGTGNGLSRYDGKKFQSFSEQASLVGVRVTAILKDDNGQLWCNTDGGLIRYNGERFHNVGPRDLISGVSSQMIEDQNGNLWFGTGNGVFKYNGESFQQFTAEDGLIGNIVYAVLEDSTGNLWFGSIDGISKYDGNTFYNFRVDGDEGFPVSRVQGILEDSSGNLWFAGYKGLCMYNGEEFKLYTVDDGLPISWTTRIIEDLEGNLWIGTQGAGMVRLERNFQNLGINPEELKVLRGGPIKDKAGNIWCNLSKGIVSKYNGQIFQTYLMGIDGVPKDTFLQYIDASGNLWFQSPKGIWKYDGKSLIPYLTTEDMLPKGALLQHIDSSGNLWLRRGTAAYDSIWMYDGKNIQQILTDENASVVLEDSIGCIWIRSGSGALKYEHGDISQFPLENASPNLHTPSLVTKIFEDNAGNIWIGTWNGLVRSEGRDFHQFMLVDKFKDIGIAYTIFQDSAGNLWFGTKNSGMCRYDGKQFQWFTSNNGLASNWVSCIYEDSKGHFWVGSRDGGVTHFDGENFQRLTTKDGLLNNFVSEVLEHKKTGTMLFPTEHGIIRYSPPAKRVPPRISVERIIADKSYDDVSEVELPSTATHITFEYYGKSFRTKQMRYNYILEGYESKWHKTWDERAEYENLEPGNYTFKVIAIDRDLIYSEKPATVKLKIVPPFYLRARFLAPTVGFGTILIAMLTIVSIGYVKRRRQVQAYQQAAVEELRDANRVQMSLMPETAPPIEGVEIAGRCIPANTVSGDFFDYLEGKNQDEIGLVVADVTGKAMKGAMNAVMADGILRMAAEEMENLSPAFLMMKLNNVLKARMERDMNVTMVIAVIDAENRTLTLSNAAHHAHPILFCDGKIQTLKTGGLPLGMRAGIEYSEQEFPLQSGDVLILMTDGIIEAEDSDGQSYSDSERLEKIISQFTQDLSAEAMVDAILNDVIRFSGDKTTRDDDMTVVVAKIA